MLFDLRSAFAALMHPQLRGLVVGSLLASLLLLVALGGGCYWLIAHANLIPWENWQWAEAILATAGALVAIVLGLLVFPALQSAVVSPFLGKVSFVLNPPPEGSAPASLWGEARVAWRGFWRALFISLALIPAYFLPGLNLVLYLLVNGRNFAYDYSTTLALQRGNAETAEGFYRQHRGYHLRTGIVIAALFLVPGLNLVAPVVGMALMTRRAARLLEQTDQK